MINVMQNCMAEWSYASGTPYADPFNDVTLDVIVTDPDGKELRIPAFWSGDLTWRVRYASPKTGVHGFRTECSDTENTDLHGRDGQIHVAPYEGANPLFAHGPLTVSADRRTFKHIDGTPFFWLGDTWWMGLCKRLEWPGEFKELLADRVAKGFSVIQIIAGLYPDMPAFDPRGANEAGFPWEADYARINPAYFDMADLRIAALVRSGLVPCIVGCWGYFLPWMGVERMKQHWRHLIARWGAWPVLWCLAGEGTMPFYLSENREEDAAFQKRGWTELGRYLHEIDPYEHPVSIHPSNAARKIVEDDSVLDFNMLQTGHGDRDSLLNTVRLATEAYAMQPVMPMLNSEVCYEGIAESCRSEIQRLMFWVSVLSGACGHTYGANGIWQLNRREQPYGPSPHGMSWGNTPWDEAAQLPGSGQLGLAKRLLERYPWWRFEPHPEWVIEPGWSEERPMASYAAGIPGEVRFLYLPRLPWGDIVIGGIEPGTSYRAFLYNPVNGEQLPLDDVIPDADGRWTIKQTTETGNRRFVLPLYQDWLIVMEATA